MKAPRCAKSVSLLFGDPYSGRVRFMRPCEETMTTVGFMAWTSFGPLTSPRFYYSEHCETWETAALLVTEQALS